MKYAGKPGKQEGRESASLAVREHDSQPLTTNLRFTEPIDENQPAGGGPDIPTSTSQNKIPTTKAKGVLPHLVLLQFLVVLPEKLPLFVLYSICLCCSIDLVQKSPIINLYLSNLRNRTSQRRFFGCCRA